MGVFCWTFFLECVKQLHALYNQEYSSIGLVDWVDNFHRDRNFEISLGILDGFRITPNTSPADGYHY